MFSVKHYFNSWDKSKIGRIGENLAERYLIRLGYKILGRNMRQGFYEIDLLAKAPNQILVFVEVKTLMVSDFSILMPEDNLTQLKLRKLQKAGQLFIAANPDLEHDEAGWQIDLIAVTLCKSRPATLRHYKNL